MSPNLILFLKLSNSNRRQLNQVTTKRTKFSRARLGVKNFGLEENYKRKCLKMPILSVMGELIPRKPIAKKNKVYRGKKVKAMKHNRNVTEEEAKRIIDAQIGYRLKKTFKD